MNRGAYLEEGEEVVQFLACVTLAKVETRGIQDEVDESNAEEVIGQIERIKASRNWRATMTERHDLVHHFEDDNVLDESVVVDFGQILDFRNAPLIVLEIVLFQPNVDGLDEVVDYPDNKICAVPVE